MTYHAAVAQWFPSTRCRVAREWLISRAALLTRVIGMAPQIRH